MNIKDMVVKKYEDKPLSEIAEAPVFALQGVSKGDAKLLNEAFRVKTVKDLANLKFFDWARQIVDGGEDEKPTPDTPLPAAVACPGNINIANKKLQVTENAANAHDANIKASLAMLGLIAAFRKCTPPCTAQETVFALSGWTPIFTPTPAGMNCKITVRLTLVSKCVKSE